MKKGRHISALMLIAIMILSSCNFGVETPTAAGDYTPVANNEVRPLPSDFSTRLAISYSGYRDGEEPGVSYPTEAEILEDLNILDAMGFTLLRLYDTSEHASRVLNVIKTNNLDMKVMLGVWISGPRATYNGKNTSACDQAVTWATGNYKDQIAAVSIGNECMVDWNTFGWATPPADIAYYVSYVRNKITQPVTVDDNWEPWSLENEQGASAYADVYMVAEAVDFIALHTYAIADAQWNLWDYKQTSVDEASRADAMMDAAVDFAKENYNAAKTALAGIGISKPIIIGETGWKSKGDAMGIAHPVNQQMYYEKLSSWVGTAGAPITCFFFEAFDEPWKGGDDNWGFFNVDREAKYVVYSDPVWDALGNPIEDTVEWIADDAVYFIEPEAPITVADNTFFVFADDVSGGYNGQLWDMDRDGTAEAVNFQWEAWENNSTAGTALDNTTANSEDAEAGSATDTVAVITPDPLNWGWGMMGLLTRQGFDLSQFSSGNLQFRIKTTYAGSLNFGIQTGLSMDNDSWDLLVEVDPSSNTYGYSNDGSWHDVSIPVSDLWAAATCSYNNDPTTSPNLSKVFIPFVVGDYTASNTTEIWVDQIRWTK